MLSLSCAFTLELMANMDLFKMTVLVFLLFCCLSNALIEPRPKSLEHYRMFHFAMSEIDQIERKVEGRMVVKNNVYTTLCGKSEVPLGEYIIGFDPDYEDSRRARKTFLSATIRPQHLGTGKDAESAAHRFTESQFLRLSDDQVGHAIGKALGGSGGECNLFAQSGQLNNGNWKRKENIVQKYLENGIQKDGAGKLIKDNSGRYQPADNRYVELKLAFEYPNDDRKDPFGGPYPAERPSKFHYQFTMYKDNTDNNPQILAGFYLNKSYLHRYKYDNVAVSAQYYYKDEPSYRSETLSLEELTSYVPN